MFGSSFIKDIRIPYKNGSNSLDGLEIIIDNRGVCNDIRN
jgi:hypothetical protein